LQKKNGNVGIILTYIRISGDFRRRKKNKIKRLYLHRLSLLSEQELTLFFLSYIRISDGKIESLIFSDQTLFPHV